MCHMTAALRLHNEDNLHVAKSMWTVVILTFKVCFTMKRFLLFKDVGLVSDWLLFCVMDHVISWEPHVFFSPQFVPSGYRRSRCVPVTHMKSVLDFYDSGLRLFRSWLRLRFLMDSLKSAGLCCGFVWDRLSRPAGVWLQYVAVLCPGIVTMW